MDYLKGLFNQYIYNSNRSDELQESIDTLEKVKVIDEKIGNIKDVMNSINELIPAFLKHPCNVPFAQKSVRYV